MTPVSYEADCGKPLCGYLFHRRGGWRPRAADITAPNPVEWVNDVLDGRKMIPACRLSVRYDNGQIVTFRRYGER